MSIFTNSIFNIVPNNIMYSGNALNVTSGSNVLEKLPLCGVKVNFKEYQKISVIIPANAVDFQLTFPMISSPITFLMILPTYTAKSVTDNTNYLDWKFITSLDNKIAMGDVLTLSSTPNNPLADILIDNPSDCDIRLNILVSGIDSTSNNQANITNLFFGGLYTVNLQTS